MNPTNSFIRLKTRPKPKERLFVSETLDQKIEQISQKIADPDIRRMFVQCLPNTLDTTIYFSRNKKGNPDTFVATGDIPAMWLRDSTNQVWPYLQFIHEDTALREMIAGLICRQVKKYFAGPLCKRVCKK